MDYAETPTASKTWFHFSHPEPEKRKFLTLSLLKQPRPMPTEKWEPRCSTDAEGKFVVSEEIVNRKPFVMKMEIPRLPDGTIDEMEYDRHFNRFAKMIWLVQETARLVNEGRGDDEDVKYLEGFGVA